MLAGELLQSSTRKPDQPIPVLVRKRLVQSMGDKLNRLNHLPEVHGDALRGGGGVIQFMRETRRHRSERGQLFVLARRAFEVAKTQRHRAKNLARDRRAEPQQDARSPPPEIR